MSHAWLNSPILSQLNSGVIVVDDEYQIHYLNAFIERHASLQLAEVQGKSIFTVFLLLGWEAVLEVSAAGRGALTETNPA